MNAETPDPSDNLLLAAITKTVEGMKTELRAAQKAASRRTWWSVVLSAVVVILVAISFVTLDNVSHLKTFNHQLQQRNIAQCIAGNAARADIAATLNFFIDAAVARKVSPQVTEEMHSISTYLTGTASTPARKKAVRALVSVLEQVTGIKKDPRLPQFVAYLENKIRQLNAPRNCKAAYSTTSFQVPQNAAVPLGK